MRNNRKQIFQDSPPEEMVSPEVNPYIEKYWNYGPPVVRGKDSLEYKGAWERLFERKAPLVLEVGSGNGFYLSGMAHKNPENNYLGLEIRYKRVILAAKKIQKLALTNARILRYDAWSLSDLFVDAELSSLVTNHPDPWKKARHRKHRLLTRPFCEWAVKAIQEGGTWRIKTDHYPHIESVLEQIKGLPFSVEGVSEDIHHSSPPWDPEDDVITNYESKFIDQDLPIYACLLKKKTSLDLR